MRRRGPADRRIVAQDERFLQERDRLAIDWAGFGVRHRFPQSRQAGVSAWRQGRSQDRYASAPRWSAQ